MTSKTDIFFCFARPSKPKFIHLAVICEKEKQQILILVNKLIN